ncbi:GAF domain-containing protein [Marinicella rhabdoformis]|uniref:GAF domain-containing protein n=1 Tax=Marinicella rhabdoformis TaxID=2580566 RepID=UPI0012AEC2BA|nr:GAF domain-containing protein [Marinicella rhabdoformis]
MKDSYALLLKQLEALISFEKDPMANAANLSAFLYHNLEQVNWLGFYFQQGDELVLGPFHGQPACTRLPIGTGVCGTAFSQKETLVIDDVHAFEGHIACDSASESEVVVPFFTDNLNGVLDIDSPVLARFTADEKALFEQATAIYVNTLS